VRLPGVDGLVKCVTIPIDRFGGCHATEAFGGAALATRRNRNSCRQRATRVNRRRCEPSDSHGTGPKLDVLAERRQGNGFSISLSRWSFEQNSACVFSPLVLSALSSNAPSGVVICFDRLLREFRRDQGDARHGCPTGVADEGLIIGSLIGTNSPTTRSIFRVDHSSLRRVVKFASAIGDQLSPIFIASVDE